MTSTMPKIVCVLLNNRSISFASHTPIPNPDIRIRIERTCQVTCNHHFPRMGMRMAPRGKSIRRTVAIRIPCVRLNDAARSREAISAAEGAPNDEEEEPEPEPEPLEL